MLKWIRNHKLTTALILILTFFIAQNFLSGAYNNNTMSLSLPTMEDSYQSSPGYAGATVEMSRVADYNTGIINSGYDKVSESANRMIIQESSLSLLVEDVRESSDEILSYTKSVGGFMINTSFNNPSDSAYATISVRVPTERLDDALHTFRSMAIRVTNENLYGTDVTDSYEDLDQRLTTLTATKTRFDEMLTRAVTVQEILEIQREIINLQMQIDSIKGQQMGIEDNAKYTRVTLYLSTDELSLPYAPDEKFRPALVFKLAVRSLLSTVQGFAEFAIWAIVFSIIWLPVVLVVFYFGYWRKRAKNRPNLQPPSIKQS